MRVWVRAALLLLRDGLRSQPFPKVPWAQAKFVSRVLHQQRSATQEKNTILLIIEYYLTDSVGSIVLLLLAVSQRVEKFPIVGCATSATHSHRCLHAMQD